MGGNFRVLMASYLTERKKNVKVNDYKSGIVPVTSVVRQEPLLGPLFFIFFVNVLRKQVKVCEVF